MIVRLERIQTPGQRYFADLLELYLGAFPEEERRDSSSLADILGVAAMYFSAVIAGDELSGMVVYWKFDRYLYIEHLAVMPEKRCKGIGRHVLQILQNEGNPVLLEVEIPFDGESRERTRFYTGCGFIPLDVDYVQPPYRKGEKLLPMLLYSDKSDWNHEILNECIHEFQSQVYNIP